MFCTPGVRSVCLNFSPPNITNPYKTDMCPLTAHFVYTGRRLSQHKPLASVSRPRWRGWRAGAGGMCARMFCARLGAHTAGQRGGRRIPRCARRRLEPSSARNLVKGAHRWRAPREAMPDAAASQAANAAHRRAPCKSPESGSPVPSEPGSGDLHGNTREQENGGIFAAVLLFAGYFVSAHRWLARTHHS